jgi:GNAT superfamily N-acetyltransferase
MSGWQPVIRAMIETDLPAAVRAYRRAFGTFLRLPDIEQFRMDNRVIETRFAADRAAAVVAELDGRVVGSSVGMQWGSVFVIGPVSVDPECWGGGIARALVEHMVTLIDARGAKLGALFTFGHSPTHLRLYESFGFAPQQLTLVTAKPVEGQTGHVPFRLCSALGADELRAAIAGCRALAETIYPGLDLTREIEAIAAQSLGETLLIEDGAGLAGFALCHIGAGTEAGEGVLFVKFAAARLGDADGFERLIAAIEHLADERGAKTVIAGMNAGRRGAYRLLQARGYRANFIGVAMHRPDQAGYQRPEVYVIDDWR